jgi:aldose 1-epimerase
VPDIFGHLPDGRPVYRVNLARAALSVEILTLGATLHSVRLRGAPHDLTAAQGTITDYLGPMQYHGKIVAPVGNRISGAGTTINGKRHDFPANQDNRITLHSGDVGTHLKLWQIADKGDDHVTLAVTLPDGEGGFPGTRQLTATFSLQEGATLRLDLQATTDAPTIFNAVNHSYWNLDGTPDVTGHSLRIAADRYLPVDADIVPTGHIAPVVGTPFDFTRTRPCQPGQPPLDTCFCLSDTRLPLRDVLYLVGGTGVAMTIATTEPGIQIYDGRRPRPGHAPYEALAIEPQRWPDAPNHPAFPSILLTPEAPYHQTSEWRFTTP